MIPFHVQYPAPIVAGLEHWTVETLDMKASEMYGSQYLAADDLSGKSITVEIVGVGNEQFKGSRDNLRPRITLDLKDVKKKLVLNTTSATVLIEAFGDETDAWLGRSITLDTTAVLFQGKRVQSIRVQAVKVGKK